MGIDDNEEDMDLPIDWDEELDDFGNFGIVEKKRQPTTEEYIERYGFGVE